MSVTNQVTGEPSGSDLREHKVTLPLIFALERMDPSARKQVERLMATPEPSDDQIADVVGLVAEIGGLEYARERAQSLAEQAESELDALPAGPARDALRPVSPMCWTAGANGEWTEAAGLLSWRTRRRIYRGRVLYRSHQGSGSGQRRQDRIHRHLEPLNRAGVD